MSSAVPGLTKERVSVVNTDGVTLHRPSSEQDGAGGLEETHSQAAREIATNMENHVRTLLERVTGPGGVDVRVNVNLDEASRERTEEHYEPTKTAVLDAVLPLYVEVELMRAMLESIASQFGAQMSAMDSASKNASEMIGKLTLQYNRARQAAITKELLEIIGGAEALKG